MARVLYSASMSLDGYIAGPGGDMSWLTPFIQPNPEADALAGRIGALLIGNRTFTGDDPNSGTDAEGAFGGTWSGPQFVVTHSPPADGGPDGVQYVSDVVLGLDRAEEAAKDGYVAVLGADIARQCLALGRLHEVLVFVEPVLLGAGTRLLDVPGGTNVALRPRSATHHGHETNLWMDVLP
ncbi:dihydrofolate reductase family protein [Arthrobacter sp. B0490]|uniref:dihydrofolate reductase family protein n=1 Tax=Arthrobacter sp. B0490 TaxID=2058891 RepID=UPI000CE4BE30|nr:dihydrofolate reductase family protein [Arthrobacter sp. B0490]